MKEIVKIAAVAAAVVLVMNYFDLGIKKSE